MEGRMHYMYLKAIRTKMRRARLLLSVIHIMSPVFSDYLHGLFMISLIFHKVIKFLLKYQIGSEKEQKIFSCFALNFHKFIHP